MFAPVTDVSLGKQPLGSQPLGSSTNDVQDLNKYRVIHELKAVDFFEHQISFSSSEPEARFEIIDHGPNVRLSTNVPKNLKR